MIRRIMDAISRWTLLAVMGVILIISVVCKAMYHFQDYPYFTKNGPADFICIGLATGVYLMLIKKRDALQEKLNCRLCFILYMAAAVTYIFLVPLKPFSDMRAVTEGAISFSKLNWKEFFADPYWEVFPGNIYLAVFWGLTLIPLPGNVYSLRIVNAVFIYLIIMLTRKIAEVYGIKYSKLVYALMLLNIPLFLYINQVYFDTPVMLLCLLAVYLYKKYDNILPAMAVLGLARYFRQSALIFMAAILICHIFEKRSLFEKETWKKETLKLVSSVVIFLLISKLSVGIVGRFIQKNSDYKSYPAWNQIYIGLNEPEFGFMDNNFSYDRSFDDVVDRVKEYGPKRMTVLLGKKTFWLWSQGTYQAERYAFGIDVTESSEKFEYDTVLTGHLLDNGQILRRLINSMMRSEYLVIFALFIWSLVRKENINRYRLFYYCFTATFLIMIVYELKSRYIFHLLPFMVILSQKYLDYTDKTKLGEKN